MINNLVFVKCDTHSQSDLPMYKQMNMLKYEGILHIIFKCFDLSLQKICCFTRKRHILNLIFNNAVWLIDYLPFYRIGSQKPTVLLLDNQLKASERRGPEKQNIFPQKQQDHFFLKNRSIVVSLQLTHLVQCGLSWITITSFNILSIKWASSKDGSFLFCSLQYEIYERKEPIMNWFIKLPASTCVSYRGFYASGCEMPRQIYCWGLHQMWHLQPPL